MIKQAGPPEPIEPDPQLPGGGGLVCPKTENAAIRTMLRPRWRKRWKTTREADAIAINATLRNMQVDDGRISNGAVSNYLKMKAQNQADEHKSVTLPDQNTQVNVQVNVGSQLGALMNEPDYLEFLQQRAITEDRNAGPVRQVGKSRPVEDGEASGGSEHGANGSGNGKGA